MSAALVSFGGLPGSGKSTLARELARVLGAAYVRIDSIEQAIRDARPGQRVEEEGYRVAYAVAEDNLRQGLSGVADSVNPCRETRDAWIAVAERAQARAVEVEVVCSDPQLHRARVESRTADIVGLRLPTWADVLARDYEPWPRPHIVIDTASNDLAETVKTLSAML